ncbi:MAG: PHP domain-containing protein [Deltaproteobacteria bacterium]|nr:PHP domain-containing protein [Deltaproteobacteria bacterium]MBW2594624.1 PHP domain-containing protein [Deltaproteobacteria bacterium]MBW2650298.1 PHP domain-containing protein [Deltaproteobacteria bacterium]
MKLYDYTGAIHFHSAHSFDGRVPVRDIIKAAGENSIDFLMITDHSALGARKSGLEGWNGDVLLVVGQEISPRFNHYLVFGIDEELIIDENDTESNPQDYIDRVKRLGGIGFIAHPDHEGTEKFHVKHFPWRDWSASGYTGMGIWDFMTDWQSTLKGLPSALAGYLFPAYVLKGPRNITLKRWDHLNKKGRVVGIGELDNHDTPRKILGMTAGIFPFKRAFRFIRTHLLLDNPLSGEAEEDIKTLLKALENGRAYMAMEYFHNAKGFSLSLSDLNREVTMGDEFFLKGEALLEVKVPERGKIRIIQDGGVVAETVGKKIMCKISQGGVYRVEAYLKIWGKYRPWIFSNPVYVR